MVFLMTEIEKLIELLGSESGDRWLEFMDYVNQNLSHILKRGKPKAEDIENSIIGKAGFKTWKEFIESPTAQGGLAWNLSTCDSWKRAYSIVCNYPFLRNLELSASFINTIYRETKPNFPISESDLNEFLAVREEKAIANQQNKLKMAENRSQELLEQLKVHEHTIALQKQEIETLKSQLAQGAAQAERLLGSEKRVSELETLLKAGETELTKAKDSLKTKSKKLNTYQSMGFLDKLKALFK